MSNLKAICLLLFNQPSICLATIRINTYCNITHKLATIQVLSPNYQKKNPKMKLILLLVAMMALFSSLALAGGKSSKYAKDPKKSKGHGV